MQQREGLVSCPNCDGALALLVEPGALEFFCQNDHTFDVDTLISCEAARARALLAQTLAFWTAQHASLVREAEAAPAGAPPAFVASCERRTRVADERIRTLQRALEKCG
jgi:hypothetical protein